MATTDFTPETYGFAQAKQSFEDARQGIVPPGWEDYVDTSKGDDTIKIWRKHDSAVRILSTNFSPLPCTSS